MDWCESGEWLETCVSAVRLRWTDTRIVCVLRMDLARTNTYELDKEFLFSAVTHIRAYTSRIYGADGSRSRKGKTKIVWPGVVIFRTWCGLDSNFTHFVCMPCPRTIFIWWNWHSKMICKLVLHLAVVFALFCGRTDSLLHTTAGRPIKLSSLCVCTVHKQQQEQHSSWGKVLTLHCTAHRSHIQI